VYGDLNVTPNEEQFLVYDALVTSELYASVKLGLGHKGTPRSIDAEAQRDFLFVRSADLAYPVHVSHSGIADWDLPDNDCREPSYSLSPPRWDGVLTSPTFRRKRNSRG
jgi:hypothetical protein